MTMHAAMGFSSAQLRQAAAGDQAAFARIVAAYDRDMLHVAYVICGEPELARDAVQAAWIKAWRKLSTVREAEHLRSWLVVVAANEARHVVRGRHRVVEIPLDEPHRNDPDPDDEIARVDLVNALRRLGPDDRALIAMRYGIGLDSTEIAARLGISASGVRARLFRLMGRLREELDDDRS